MNENEKSLLKVVKQGFGELKTFILKTLKDEKKEDVKRLDNLFKGFKDWNKQLGKKKLKPYLHPYKIFDYEAKIDEEKLLTDQEKNTISKSIGKLRKLIKSYYETDGKASNVRFYIETAGHGGEYRLRAKIGDEDIEDILNRIREQKILPKLSSEDQKQILDQYLEQVKKTFCYLDTKHIPILPLPDNAIKLDKVYINLRATDEVPLSEAMHLTDATKDISGIPDRFIEEKKIITKKQHTSLPIDQVLQKTLNEPDSFKKHMLFLGPPGSGKTTLLKYLAYSFALGESKEWELKSFFPFYIELGDYSRSGHSDLMQYILDKTAENIAGDEKKNFIKKVFGDFINECNKNPQEYGQLIFLMDALDETRGKKEKVVNQIESFRDRYSNGFIIVTSRITRYYDVPLKAFDPYLIEDLKITEIHHFISEFFKKIREEKEKKKPGVDWNEWVNDRIGYLRKEIDDKPSLKRIATSPLYLTFLVFLASDPDKTILPKTRCELYDLYFKKLFYKWEEKYKEPLPLEEDDLFGGFKEICWIIHRSLFGNIHSDPTEEFIKDSIKNSVKVDIGKLFNFWVKAGIFQRVQTRGYNELILPRHLSFLEYGFACKLAQLWDGKGKTDEVWDHLKHNFHNTYLFEPLTLFFSKLRDPTTFIQRVLYLKDDLFYYNLIFACLLVNEIKAKLRDNKIVKLLLDRCLIPLHSPSNRDLMIEYDLLRLVCQIGGIDVLRQLFYGKKISISVQEHIITILLEYGKEKAISILEELIKGTNRKLDDMIKAYIASELARCGGRDQFPLIESIFNEIHGDDWRQWIIDGISECRDVESLLLLERLTDKSNKNSLSLKTIVSLIGKHTNKYPVDTLKQLIKKVDIFSQVRIAAFIGMAGEKTLALLLLRQIYAEATDSLDKVEIALEIIKFGDKSYVPLLKNLFTEESEHWRRDRILDLLYYGLEHSDLIVILKELFNEQVDRDVKELVACYFSSRR